MENEASVLSDAVPSAEPVGRPRDDGGRFAAVRATDDTVAPIGAGTSTAPVALTMEERFNQGQVELQPGNQPSLEDIAALGIGKFMDPHGIVDVNAMAKSYQELQRAYTAKSQAAAVPDKYVPPKAAVDLLGTVEDASTDRVMRGVMDAAREAGLSQKQLDAVVGRFIQLSTGPEFDQHEHDAWTALHCGGDVGSANQRATMLFNRLQHALRPTGGADDPVKVARFRTVVEVMRTARGRDLVESFMNGAFNRWISQPTQRVADAPDFGAAARPHNLTHERVVAMQADKRFGADAVYTREVMDAWKRLYPGQTSA